MAMKGEIWSWQRRKKNYQEKMGMTETMELNKKMTFFRLMKSRTERHIRSKSSINFASIGKMGSYGYQKGPRAGRQMDHIAHDVLVKE